jgi:hypothetical protein
MVNRAERDELPGDAEMREGVFDSSARVRVCGSEAARQKGSMLNRRQAALVADGTKPQWSKQPTAEASLQRTSAGKMAAQRVAPQQGVVLGG